MRDSTKVVAFGEHALDFGRGELRHREKPVDIQPTPLRLLLYLGEHRDRVVSRQELLDAIWPGVVVGDEALTTALAEARHAVGDDGAAQRVIRTYKGRGYRFVAEVTADSAGAHAKRSLRKRTALVVAGALVATLLAAWVVAPRLSGEAQTALRSIAVLPLENLSGDPSEDTFAKAMTDVLISELGQLPGVRVISRTSVEAVARSRSSLREIARELDVEGIVEGSVVRERKRVRITVRLIDVSRDRHLWSASFERDLSRALEIQGEVSREIASQIRVAITPELARRFSRERVLTREAQDAYFQGLLRSVRFDRESMRAAVTEFERAARLAPDYAPAHAQLAAALARTAVYDEPDAETLRRAEHHVSRALQLDDEFGDAHFILATLHLLERDWPLADAEFARGIALGVHEPIVASAYAFHLLALGQPDAAVSWMNDVAASAPFDLFVSAQRGRVLYLAGRAQSALREFDRILAAENPRDAQIFALRTYAEESLGRFDEAIRDFRRFIEVAGHDERRAFADELEAALRSRGAAGYWSVWARVSKDSPLRAASAHAHTGELDAAFAALDEAWETRSTISMDVYFVRSSPSLAPLKGDSRFVEFVRRLPQRSALASAKK